MEQDLNEGATLSAVFVPRNPEAVPPWAEHMVGQRGGWIARFRLGPGPYEGQWAMSPWPPEPGAQPVTQQAGWIPLAHLRDIERLGPAQTPR